ncbi:MAG TPA: hypothetical protein PKD98_09590 [Anaerolineae bacterium]|nr:hypothetical protein [Anaerolineae bacterium]
MQTQSSWQPIIWREWRHCADPDYAERLFELVADGPVGFGARLSLTLFNALAGAALAVLAGGLISFTWAFLQHFIWAGGLIGAIIGIWQGRQLTWRNWLERLSANAPVGSLGRLIAGLLALGLMSGIILGPIAWLLGLGLFWTVGAMINWLNQGLTDQPRTSLDDRRWWFWWRSRPHPLHVEAALHLASEHSLADQAVWAEPLRQIEVGQWLTLPSERLVRQLWSNDWIERFTARHTLLRLGDRAIAALQPLTQGQETPLQRTAVWLIESIERQPAPVMISR